MTYNEFTSYLAERIMAVRSHENRRAFSRNYSSYSDAAYKAVLECRAFFERFSLDEGPHNDYNPSSNVSVEAYRAAMYEQIAVAMGKAAGAACVLRNTELLDSVLIEKVKYGETVSDQRFARVASEYLSNIVFKRSCAGCGAQYDVAIKAQTYRMISNHPANCTAVRATPVQVAKPEKPEVKGTVKPDAKRVVTMMERVMNWEARQKNINGPVIPPEMLEPTHKPAYNSPAYRANAKAALRLYADFLKFYEEDPSPKSDPEKNQLQIERMYNVVIRTVFNFDPEASKKR